MTIASLPKPVGRQREVLYLPAHGRSVVLGTAGSRKTTLAILRSLYLSDPSTTHGGRTLPVTFNRGLVILAHLAAVGGRAKKIEEALGLIPRRTRTWLERTERGGERERASRNPVTHTLTRKSPL